ncbi:MAG TPA: hypothetical protein VF487_20220 [Chitinophagaceae bacterium]
MKTLILPMLLFSGLANGQKIFFDKTDPFTKERTVSTDNVKLVPSILEAGTSAIISKEKKSLAITFIAPKFLDIKTSTSDTTSKACMIMLSSGEVLIGEWKSDNEVPIGAKIYTTSSFAFTEDAFKKIAASTVTNIKITGTIVVGLFEIKEKAKDKLPKLCSVLLSAI